MTATEADTVAELRRANVGLQEALDAALAQWASEFSERIEHQAATTDVLKALSASPGDAQPVFDLITHRAVQLCNGMFGTLYEYDGELMHIRSTHGWARDKLEAFARQFPIAPTRAITACHAVLDRQTIHVRDLDAKPGLSQAALDLGHKSLIAVPMLRESAAIGVILVARKDVDGFTDAHVELLKTFAEQAVIAITSAETYRALQTRTSELQDSLEHQTATSDVLKVISGSDFALEPVFQAVVETAARLCRADLATIYRLQDNTFRWAAGTDMLPEYKRRMRASVVGPGTGTLVGRVALEGRPVQILDQWTDPLYEPKDDARTGGVHTTLGVPLLRDGVTIGAIGLGRCRIEPFTDRQIELVATFADQAVIAIENARLITEQREALEQQTATAEVLQVINASPGNLAPVFDAMLEKVMRLCEAGFGSLYTYDGDQFQSVAQRGVSAAYTAYRERHPPELVGGAGLERAIRTRRAVQITDMMAERPYLDGNPNARAMVDLGGMRTGVVVPLCKDETALGVISVFRQEVQPFSDRQVALLENFAAQAVIAMENARLLDELQTRTAELAARNTEFAEQIEHQSATIEVLKAMSASPGDAQPVFELIARRALEFCGATGARLIEFDGKLQRLRALARADGIETEADRALRELYPSPPEDGTIIGRVILEGVIVQDVSPDGKSLHGRYRARGGVGSVVGVPLMRDGSVAGGIAISRPQTERFTDTQVELLKTFAEQAVIAIRGAETFRELEARTAALALRNSEFGERIDQQAATIDVLKVMSASPDDTQPIFDQIVRRAQELCNGFEAALFEYDGELVHYRAACSATAKSIAEEAASGPVGAAYVAMWPMVPAREFLSCQVILDRQIVHVQDVGALPDLHHAVQNIEARSRLGIPLLRDGVAIGAIALTTLEAGGFKDSQVELLKTFAEQAVIAITSVATYRQLRERTAELTRSVAELQALEEVLRAVNSSLDLETVLATIISRSVRLSQADEGMIYEFDATEEVFVPKAAFGMTEERIARLRERRIRIGETYLGRSAVERVPVQVEDVQQDASTPTARDFLQGIHAVLAVPLLREDSVVGGLVIRRRSEGAFALATVTLMQTFAAQCVLAIENARLFEAARRARAASDAALADLRRVQDQLVQTEKMASLGQLTAGIAHEIKNPLNFVNNFSALSAELVDELHDALAPAPLGEIARAEVNDLTALLKGNLEKVVQHGKRADGIVKAMLEHSRGSSVERRMVDLNALIDEALNLAYHGGRAQDQSFNITLERDFGEGIAPIEVNPQDMTRVFLNIFSNGFYAATRRARNGGGARFVPTLKVTTRDCGEAVEIRVRDNGTGIPADIRDKLFQPFFTTKPTGEGTGLGLSITYDIITNGHSGTITVESEVDAFSEFTVALPRKP